MFFFFIIFIFVKTYFISTYTGVQAAWLASSHDLQNRIIPGKNSQKRPRLINFSEADNEKPGAVKNYQGSISIGRETHAYIFILKVQSAKICLKLTHHFLFSNCVTVLRVCKLPIKVSCEKPE